MTFLSRTMIKPLKKAYLKLKRLKKALTHLKRRLSPSRPTDEDEQPPLPPQPHYLVPVSRRDGYFICATCGTENTLIHSPGPYPFAYVRCISPYCKPADPLGHVITATAETSRVIQRFPSTANDPIPVPLLTGVLKATPPFFTVCPVCGLSHRARRIGMYTAQKMAAGRLRVGRLRVGRWVKRLFGLPPVGDGVSFIGFEHIVCACNKQATGQWLRFSIRPDYCYHIDGDVGGYYAEEQYE
ncbi:hypothetical protein BU26DRAFT_570669 [Trematosphaeria pertusa]|uniref:Probable double zinc ribbon domain-containing protein n=1 Tax=Trematosphaeria pertusa TaxID=390896 RepID=A0A6A6HYA3_9PLEO|nr:uncharacterized protein BU26DRAFT_570669 [Trematosphaeria pertusa]KAF2242593.1 hypothetical protein BU26DRAFT_570669 [Trematosphaeria pertusa]